jgi:GT2 family glycosyltransferase
MQRAAMTLLPLSPTASIRPAAVCKSPGTENEPPFVCGYVITYNGKRFLERCFQSLQDLTDYANCQFVLVDNGSSDGSGDYVRDNFPGVDVLRVFPNAGYVHGANKAIADARRRGARYIVLMNDDIEILHPHWLGDAVESIERDPDIGAIGVAEVNFDDERNKLPESEVSDVEYLSSPVMVMPVELFDRIGMFDEVYYVVADENDVGARAQAAGYRVVSLSVPVFHFGGGTNQSFGRTTAYYQMRNGIRFCLKNRSSVRALMRAARILDVACNPWPVSFDKNDAAHCRMRNSGNVAVNIWLWVKAVSWNVIHLPQTLRIRAAEQALIRAAREARIAQANTR